VLRLVREPQGLHRPALPRRLEPRRVLVEQPLREAIVLRPPRNRVAVTLELGRDLVLRDTLERQDERLLALRRPPWARRRHDVDVDVDVDVDHGKLLVRPCTRVVGRNTGVSEVVPATESRAGLKSAI